MSVWYHPWGKKQTNACIEKLWQIWKSFRLHCLSMIWTNSEPFKCIFFDTKVNIWKIKIISPTSIMNYPMFWSLFCLNWSLFRPDILHQSWVQKEHWRRCPLHVKLPYQNFLRFLAFYCSKPNSYRCRRNFVFTNRNPSPISSDFCRGRGATSRGLHFL